MPLTVEDQDKLHKLLGGAEPSEKLLKLYDETQVLYHRLTNGSFSAETLSLMCALSGQFGKQGASTRDWLSIRTGTPVLYTDSDGHKHQGVFTGVVSEGKSKGRLNVKLDGAAEAIEVRAEQCLPNT